MFLRREYSRHALLTEQWHTLNLVPCVTPSLVRVVASGAQSAAGVMCIGSLGSPLASGTCALLQWTGGAPLSTAAAGACAARCFFTTIDTSSENRPRAESQGKTSRGVDLEVEST